MAIITIFGTLGGFFNLRDSLTRLFVCLLFFSIPCSLLLFLGCLKRKRCRQGEGNVVRGGQQSPLRVERGMWRNRWAEDRIRNRRSSPAAPPPRRLPWPHALPWRDVQARGPQPPVRWHRGQGGGSGAGARSGPAEARAGSHHRSGRTRSSWDGGVGRAEGPRRQRWCMPGRAQP